MEKKSVGRRIWNVISPVVIKYAVEFTVLWVILSVYFMQQMPELMEIADTQEELVNKVLEMSEGVYQYAVEISAIASLFTIPILLIMKKRDLKKEKETGIIPNKKAPLYKYVFVAMVGVALALVANNLITLSDLAEYSESYQEAAEALYAPSLPVQIVCVGVILPICEEIVFRGLVYRRMRQDMSVRRAIVMSAIFFGVYHMNMVQIIYATICGLFLAYVYEKYGSIKAPILAHIVMNTMVCVLSDVNAFTWMFSNPMRMAIITIACAAIGSSVFLVIKQIDEKPDMPEVQKEEVED